MADLVLSRLRSDDPGAGVRDRALAYRFDFYYRDVRLSVPFLLQFVFYLSPVIYAASAIPSSFRLFFSLNPLTGLLNGFRWSLVAGAPPPSLFEVEWVVGLTLVTLVGGLMVFARFEPVVVDRI